MTTFTTPKINKVYRVLWRVNGITAYQNVSAEGHELLIIGADGDKFSSVIVGWCPEFSRESEPPAVEPFRAMPPLPRTVEAPVQDVEDVPEEVVEPVTEPEPPPVPDYVRKAAKALALQVWSAAPVSRAREFAGIFPATAEQYLNHAVHMQWVVADGDRLTRGAVDPRPMEDLPTERSSRGMWTSIFR